MKQYRIDNGALQRYEQYLRESEHAPATVEKYIRDVRAFFEVMQGRDVNKIAVVAYKESLSKQYAPSSVNSMLAAINSFFSFMEWHDCRVKPLKIQRSNYLEKDRELSREEYYRLLHAADRRGDMRLFYLMQTVCSTGIRVSEIEFVTVQSLQRGKTEVRNKGRIRTVYLPGKLCRELKKYCRKAGVTQGSVFVTRTGRPLDRSNIWAMMKSLCKAAGVAAQKVFPHNLRHLFARVFYRLEHDLDRLATVLGHCNVNTTRIYTRTGESERRQIERLRLLL